MPDLFQKQWCFLNFTFREIYSEIKIFVVCIAVLWMLPNVYITSTVKLNFYFRKERNTNHWSEDVMRNFMYIEHICRKLFPSFLTQISHLSRYRFLNVIFSFFVVTLAGMTIVSQCKTMMTFAKVRARFVAANIGTLGCAFGAFIDVWKSFRKKERDPIIDNQITPCFMIGHLVSKYSCRSKINEDVCTVDQTIDTFFICVSLVSLFAEWTVRDGSIDCFFMRKEPVEIQARIRVCEWKFHHVKYSIIKVSRCSLYSFRHYGEFLTYFYIIRPIRARIDEILILRYQRSLNQERNNQLVPDERNQ